ncbi:MAG: ATP-binding protein, partial [Candidatus Promineifilaceae bacterium]
MAGSSLSNNPIFNLADQIAEVYSIAEMRRLCAYLDYHALSKQEQTGLPFDYAYTIVDTFQRHRDLAKLQQRLTANRPDEDWEPLFALFQPAKPQPEPVQNILPELPKPPKLPTNPKPPSPYKGLHFYRKEDAALFFGRGRLVDDLLARLPDPFEPSTERNPSIVNFLPIIGASGSGKSSLVRAGMLPKLEAQGWRVCVIRPDKNPLRSLLEIAQTVAQADTLDTMLSKGKANALDLALLDYRKANTPFLLVIDQFEELFTTLPLKPSDENDTNAQKRYDEAQAQRQLFIANLMYAVESASNGMTTVLITLRA